jgi:hypothetical protein
MLHVTRPDVDCRSRVSRPHRYRTDPFLVGVATTPGGFESPWLPLAPLSSTDDDELLVSMVAGAGKARAVDRNGKVSLYVLDERWSFAYVQVYADAEIDRDRDRVVDVTWLLPDGCRASRLVMKPVHTSRRWLSKRIASSSGAALMRLSRNRRATFTATMKPRGSHTGCRAPSVGCARLDVTDRCALRP